MNAFLHKGRLITAILLLSTFLPVKYGLCQDAAAFNEVYVKTYVETAPKDFNRALDIADSLFSSSKEPIYRAKSLMLSASLYHQGGNLKRAVEFAEQAEDIIVTTDDYNWQVRVFGFLASQYRSMKLYSQSKFYSDKALSIIPRIGDQDVANRTRALMNQEQAYYYVDQKAYETAVQHLEVASIYFDKSPGNTDVQQANNFQLLGLCYYHLGNDSASLRHYDTGLSYLRSYQETFMAALIYTGMAAVYLRADNLPATKLYIDSATAAAAQSNYLPVQNEILEILEGYYIKTKDIKNLAVIRREKDSVRRLMFDSTASFMDSQISKLVTTNKSIITQKKNQTVAVIAVLLLLIAFIVYGIYYRIHKRKQEARFRNIIKQLRERDAQPPVNDIASSDLTKKVTVVPLTEPTSIEASMVATSEGINAEPQNAKTALIIPQDTREKILIGLKSFEQSHEFVNRNLSLSYLATRLNTNTKYLSRVINSDKGKDFNNYINELRINYIIKQLNDLPSWRRYKLSVIAEEAGFSSHKKFSSVFKSVVGVPPSTFIQYLEKEQVE